MALVVTTDDAPALLTLIRNAIDDGSVRTWTYDSDGDFTHVPPQWTRRAWMRPKVSAHGNLIFSIITPRNARLTKGVYAVYHGRLAEMLLAHFDASFEGVRATALPSFGDIR